MSTYPFAIDSDTEIPRISDNITETAGESINALRDSMFAVQDVLGISPDGSAGSVSDRLNVSLNPDGTIKASALITVGLASLPIVDSQVAFNAGIKEYKLSLDFSTSDLHTAILANQALLTSLTLFSNSIFSDLNLHISGAKLLTDSSPARHVLSHIDVNSIPTDSRDPSFNWSGLKDKNNVQRTAIQAAQALQQINDDLTGHENAIVDAHIASAITVDTSHFIEVPQTANSAQKMFDYLDEAEVLNMGNHRATQHSNGVPRKARTELVTVIPTTSATAYLVHSPATGPVDDLSSGDDIIKFKPDNTNFIFDAKFSQVRIGDIVTVNYGNSIEVSFPVESIRFVPNSEWVVRINGTNLFETLDGYATASISKPLFDTNTFGVLAVASANASGPSGPSSFSSILSSVIIGNPKGAVAFGLGFDPGQLNSSHYNLYLEFYPTGNPADHIILMPAIDVTGDLGASPGSYTLESVTEAINNNFRRIGYNYRFIAFAHQGEVGIMLADTINGAGFAIITGSNNSGTLIASTYTNNIIGLTDDFDALGFGLLGSNLASPAYQSTWTDSTAAQIPTKIILPVKNRNYFVNGQRKNTFESTYLANSDGYWDGYISARNPVGIFTIETTYTINLDLAPAGLKAGKTIVIQPAISFSDAKYNDVDYGRFIIKNIVFNTPCGGSSGSTIITVINGIHAKGSGFGFSSLPPLPVRIYFGADSVSFNLEEVIDQSPTINQYIRSHEIYIDNKGHTFSHERARLPRQVEDVNKLNTFNFHLKNISPKLRGYQGTNPLVFNKLIRFYVLSYDSTSGSYDGYIGKISGVNDIVSPGPITTGRKNVSTRFFDETNLDFIDVVFEENSVSPGNNILSTASPRYVDIELFPSLQLDDEFMILAFCEVNWQPATNQYIIQHVTDARQFGSVSETDFTFSALDFISAGDRFLHENGVIQGLDLDSVGTNGEIFFKGGIALVNGKIATVNNMSVVIPQVSNVSSGLPQTLQWIICVNQNNNLVPVLLTNTEIQFFATPGSSNYYIESITLFNLVNTRKDLTPIAIASVTINSITINTVKDIRRFITSNGLNNYLTWVSDNKTIGHFHSFDAVVSWINNYSSSSNYIQVKGTFDISSSLDFTTFNKPVTFDGLQAVFNVTASRGFLISSNVTLKNITFNYNPVMSFITLIDNVNTGNGCIYGKPTTVISDINIIDCNFTCSLGTVQRPPFIGFELSKGDIISRLKIEGCRFNDENTTKYQSAIAIIGLQDGSSTDPAVLANSSIVGNICNSQQSIVLTTVISVNIIGIVAYETWNAPGLNATNVIISKNKCSTIGYCVSSTKHSSESTLIDGYFTSNSLIISENNTNIIGLFGSTGFIGGASLFQIAVMSHGTGNVLIENNFANWIQVGVANNNTNKEKASVKIVNNTLTAGSSVYLAGYNSTTNAAICIIGNSSASENPSVSIINNTITQGFIGSIVYTYSTGIHAVSDANIKDNYISGFVNYGISVLPVATLFNRYDISGNNIYRDPATTIQAYIANLGVTTISTSSALIVDNTFSSIYTDSGNTLKTTIINNPDSWLCYGNKNQTVTQIFHARQGKWSIISDTYQKNVIFGTVGATQSSAIVSNYHEENINLYYYNDTVIQDGYWIMPLSGNIPFGVTITALSVTAANISNATTANIDLSISTRLGGVATSAPAALTTNDVVYPLTIPANSIFGPTVINTPIPQVFVHIEVYDGSNAAIIKFTSFTIEYYW